MAETFFDTIKTNDGEVSLLTKTKLHRLFNIPNTTAMPQRLAQLGTLGVQIQWSTKDLDNLQRCHNRLIEVIKEIGLSGLRDCANQRGGEAVLMWIRLLTPELAKHVKKII